MRINLIIRDKEYARAMAEVISETGKDVFVELGPPSNDLADNDNIIITDADVRELCKVANNSKWINSKKKEVDNEKYAFRCFLLRLGFIGDEFKADRKILLKNLDGSSAFKIGKETK